MLQRFATEPGGSNWRQIWTDLSWLEFVVLAEIRIAFATATAAHVELDFWIISISFEMMIQLTPNWFNLPARRNTRLHVMKWCDAEKFVRCMVNNDRCGIRARREKSCSFFEFIFIGCFLCAIFVVISTIIVHAPLSSHHPSHWLLFNEYGFSIYHLIPVYYMAIWESKSS